MTLIAGLGNPGDQYKKTRHNIGFMVADHLISDRHAVNISKKEFFGELFKTPDFLILKPTTFMNLSGRSLQAVISYYKVDRVIVIHDDKDLDFGSLRFKFGGSSGGHNGLKSIDSLYKPDYFRVRIGVGKPPSGFDTADFVLSRFASDQEQSLPKLIKSASDASVALITKELSEVSAKYTQKGIDA